MKVDLIADMMVERTSGGHGTEHSRGKEVVKLDPVHASRVGGEEGVVDLNQVMGTARTIRALMMFGTEYASTMLGGLWKAWKTAQAKEVRRSRIWWKKGLHRDQVLIFRYVKPTSPSTYDAWSETLGQFTGSILHRPCYLVLKYSSTCQITNEIDGTE